MNPSPQHFPLPRRACRRTGAFTLIEMLAVLGIILLLMALAVVGYRVLEKGAAEKSTSATLDTAAAMLTQYESTGGNTQDLSNLVVKGLNNNNIPNPVPPVTLNDLNAGMADRATAITVSNNVLTALTRNPTNKEMLAKLPTKAFATDNNGNRSIVPADAWGYPLLLVPPTGLQVTTETGAKAVITAPGSSPFWVSPGPDGLLSTNGDNVYSFSKK